MSVTTAAKRSIADFIASVKQATDHETDEGTSHPVAKVDAGTQAATEGARSAENSADIIDAVGIPAVDAEDDVTDQVGTYSAAKDQHQVGTKKAPTGEDPSVETASVNATLKDPGTSHPASTDNADLGSKYASMSTADLAKTAAALANQLLSSSELATAMQGGSTAGHAAGSQHAKQAQEAAQAGWDLAGLVAGDFDKQAMDAALVHRMEDIIKTAAHDADNVIEYLTAYAEQKQAMAMSPQDMAMASEMGGMSPQDMAMAAQMGGMSPQDMAMAGQMGGMPPQDMAMAGQMGGMPGSADAEPSIEEIIQMLLASGVSPEELMAALAAAGGGDMSPGMASSMSPAMGASLPPAMGASDAMAPGGLEVEAAAKRTAMPTKAMPTKAMPTKGMPPSEELKQAMASYFQELVARNRKA